jgi:signal transduction histidine kinase
MQDLYGALYLLEVENTLSDEAVQRLRAIIERALAQLRYLCNGMHPTGVCELGLAAALQHLARTYTSPQHGPVIELVLGHLPKLPAPIVDEIFAIVHCALINVLRHSQARHVQVRLATDADQLTLEIIDDGIGFTVSDASQTQLSHTQYGLAHMRRRAWKIGAELTIHTAPGRGACIRCVYPLAPQTFAGAQEGMWLGA